MKVSALAQWYGSNRTLAREVGEQLGKLKWCGIPFVGACCELKYIRTASGMASDLHRHVINLAACVANPTTKAALSERLDRTLYHPGTLRHAQLCCLMHEMQNDKMDDDAKAMLGPDVDWAYCYFVASWMGRGGRSGTKGEFDQTLSVRWTTSGGDSCVRFRSAVDALDDWHDSFAPWAFVCLDAFDFLDKFKPKKGHGLYVDAPWPEAGDKYAHGFDEAKQRELARRLAIIGSTDARVVVRFNDHPLIRELYPESKWNWMRQTSRDQANADVSEVLILNGPNFTSRP